MSAHQEHVKLRCPGIRSQTFDHLGPTEIRQGQLAQNQKLKGTRVLKSIRSVRSDDRADESARQHFSRIMIVADREHRREVSFHALTIDLQTTRSETRLANCCATIVRNGWTRKISSSSPTSGMWRFRPGIEESRPGTEEPVPGHGRVVPRNRRAVRFPGETVPWNG